MKSSQAYAASPILLACLAIAVIGGIATLAYHAGQGNASTVAPPPTVTPAAKATASALSTPTPVSSPTAIPTPSTQDPIAGWKTYSDAQNKVSFKYPTTWTADKDNASNNFLIDFRSPESVAAKEKNTVNYQADVILISYFASLKNLNYTAKAGSSNNAASLSDWLKSQKGSPAVQDYSEVMMQLTNYGTYPVYSVGNSYPSTSYYMEISGKIFELQNGSGGPLSDIDKNILQSIKITQ